MIFSLKTRQQFLFLRKHADFYRFKYFYIQLLPCDPKLHGAEKGVIIYNNKQNNYAKNNQSVIRLGITVTKSNYKTAVKRNLIKRQVRSVMVEAEILQAIKDLGYGFDINFIIKPNFDLMNYSDFKKQLIKFFKITLSQ